MGRVDIIVGKLKPTKELERKPDSKQSSDFVQKVDMSEDDMMYEVAGEAVLQAIKQSDAKALAQALCDLFDLHTGASKDDSEDVEY